MATGAATLAAQLADAAEAFAVLVGSVSARAWRVLPAADTWSVGKDAEHVAEAMAYHQWIVRLTIGEKVPSRRPPLERTAMTTRLSPEEAVVLIRARAAEAATVVAGLTADQLGLPTRPPRARAAVLAHTIERVMVGHIRAHHAEVAAKLRSLSG